MWLISCEKRRTVDDGLNTQLFFADTTQSTESKKKKKKKTIHISGCSANVAYDLVASNPMYWTWMGCDLPLSVGILTKMIRTN